jgi:1,4-alpha-glucan branching enzyme
MSDLWYKNTIIYGVDVAVFQDSNGDGIGDFQGLLRRLDYLAELGVTTLWLLPFYPSPRRDNGYDVTDYYAVHPKLGTLDDFMEVVHRAGEYGIRILLDLVMDHTSNEHPGSKPPDGTRTLVFGSTMSGRHPHRRSSPAKGTSFQAAKPPSGHTTKSEPHTTTIGSTI